MDASSLLLDPCDCESAPRERRTHARIPASELDWIQEVRLKYGPSVSLVDLSSGGALLHAPVQLRPGSTRVLEIVSADVEAVPFHVLRCHIAYLSNDGPVYSGAGAFRRPIDVTPRRRAAPALRPDLTLKELVQTLRQLGAAHNGDPRQAPGRALSGVLRSTQTAASGQDPLTSAVRQVLAEIVPAVERGETMAALQARLEECLRRSMPSLGIALSPAPLPALPGKETIYFAGSTAANGHPIVNVELAAGTAIPGWQFRLLQASGYLLEILSLAGLGLRTDEARRCARAPEEVASRRELKAPLAPAVEPPPERRPGWQKIVVRYRHGDLLKGYTHDFHPSRQKFSLWPTLDALSDDRVHIPTCLLKAVFFVRDFDGNPDYEPRQTFADGSRRAGRRIEVTFEDGEVLVGTTHSYRPDSVGFFVEPADEGSNNQRVFVLRGATRHVRFL